jgi:hypothetical protein
VMDMRIEIKSLPKICPAGSIDYTLFTSYCALFTSYCVFWMYGWLSYP